MQSVFWNSAFYGVKASELNCERNALTIADQMTLAAQLGPISGIRSCPRPPKQLSRNSYLQYNSTRPFNLPVARQPVQQNEMYQLPDARLLPVA
jgi:hypothetical protein